MMLNGFILSIAMFSAIMLNGLMLNVNMPSVIMLTAIMPNVLMLNLVDVCVDILSFVLLTFVILNAMMLDIFFSVCNAVNLLSVVESNRLVIGPFCQSFAFQYILLKLYWYYKLQ